MLIGYINYLTNLRKQFNSANKRGFSFFCVSVSSITEKIVARFSYSLLGGCNMGQEITR